MSTATTTIEVPIDLAQLLDTPEKQAEALAFLRERFGDTDDDIDPEALADLEAAIKEAETDPGLPMDEAFAEIRARFHAHRANPASSAA